MDFHGNLVGIVVNPKLGRPLLVTSDKAGNVGIRRMDAEDWTREGYGRFEGECGPSEYGWPCEVSGCTRVHTPSGVRTKGEGYGTALYVALVLAAAQEDRLRLHLSGSGDCISSGDPGRSMAADRWWERAVADGLASDVEGEMGEEEVKEENVDATRELKQLVMGETFEYGDHTFTVDYVNKISVDGTAMVSGDSRTAQVLHYETAAKAGLIVTDLPFSSEDIHGHLDRLWTVVQKADVDMGVHLIALLALDVRGLTLPAINLLGVVAQKVEATGEQLGHLRMRWELNLDPDEPIRQMRLRINAADARAAQRAVDEVTRYRRTLGWDQWRAIDA